MSTPSSTATARPTAKRAAATAIKRDPAKTRANILKAATAEFAAKGYSGARTEKIAQRAKSNVRMIYHYFGGKEALYLCVLEEVLSQLRAQELQLNLGDVAPLQGVLLMFDFINRHFERHPELRNLLAYENLNKAACLKRSRQIPQMASPVLQQLEQLLRRGEAEGCFRAGIDAMQLYVAMVGAIYYGKSHAYTLSRIFRRDMLTADWQASYRQQTHQMLVGFLTSTTPVPSVA